MILGLQITALIFVLVMVYFANLHYKRGDLNNLEMFFWLISWIGAIFLIAFPDIFTVFAQSIAISRSFDLAVIGGFIIVIPIVYLSYIRTKRLEKKFQDLIRQEALSKLKESKQK